MADACPAKHGRDSARGLSTSVAAGRGGPPWTSTGAPLTITGRSRTPSAAVWPGADSCVSTPRSTRPGQRVIILLLADISVLDHGYPGRRPVRHRSKMCQPQACFRPRLSHIQRPWTPQRCSLRFGPRNLRAKGHLPKKPPRCLARCFPHKMWACFRPRFVDLHRRQPLPQSIHFAPVRDLAGHTARCRRSRQGS